MYLLRLYIMHLGLCDFLVAHTTFCGDVEIMTLDNYDYVHVNIVYW